MSILLKNKNIRIDLIDRKNLLSTDMANAWFLKNLKHSLLEIYSLKDLQKNYYAYYLEYNWNLSLCVSCIFVFLNETFCDFNDQGVCIGSFFEEVWFYSNPLKSRYYYIEHCINTRDSIDYFFTNFETSSIEICGNDGIQYTVKCHLYMCSIYNVFGYKPKKYYNSDNIIIPFKINDMQRHF